ncbi:MAG: helix-turn-helix domain-containing protein [Burkholderiaceae bacterium]|nr:helix-turn-helix domain-containing protein [Burkholderiaceae bacterium]
MDFTLQTLDHLKPLIKGFRKKANLTQSAMAEKLGISQQSYAQIEANPASTSVERLFTILRLMQVSIQLTDDNPDTVPTIQVTKRITQRRAAQQASHIIGPAAPKNSTTRQTPPRDQYAVRQDPGYSSARLETGKSTQATAPAKVIRPNDTTKW